jgi:hypothetical protein
MICVFVDNWIRLGPQINWNDFVFVFSLLFVLLKWIYFGMEIRFSIHTFLVNGQAYAPEPNNTK